MKDYCNHDPGELCNLCAVIASRDPTIEGTMNPAKGLTVSIPKDWWPICRKCGRAVDAVVSLPGTGDRRKDAVRDYEVHCHGEKEKRFVGIWAACEIAEQRKRLPDAFTTNPAKELRGE